MERWDVVIIGAGVAGLSTALWARRLGLSAAVLEHRASVGGQLLKIRLPIIDYPGFKAGRGTALAATLLQQAREAGAAIRLNQPVTGVDCAARSCTTREGTVAGRAVVLATGLLPRRLEAPGAEALYGSGLVRRPSEELEWFRGKQVAVIGGGDRAAENALLLARVAAQVHLVHRRAELRAREGFQADLQATGNVRLRLTTVVTAVGLSGARANLTLTHEDGQEESLPVDAVCVYIGNQPNTGLVQGQVALTPDGYLQTDQHGQTSVPGLYAAGDVCTPPEYQSLITASGQSMAVAKHIALHCK